MQTTYLADWQPFGHLTVDWGNVAAWTGTTLSVVSIAAVLYVIVRDRQYRQQETASKFHANKLDEAGPGDKRRAIISLYNSSDNLIVQPHVVASPKKSLRKRGIRDVAVAHLPLRSNMNELVGTNPIYEWHLKPKEEAQLLVYITDDTSHEEYTWHLQFRTAGQNWVRDLDTYDLRLRQHRWWTRFRIWLRDSVWHSIRDILKLIWHKPR